MQVAHNGLLFKIVVKKTAANASQILLLKGARQEGLDLLISAAVFIHTVKCSTV